MVDSVQFTTAAAQKIATAVRQVLGQPTSQDGAGVKRAPRVNDLFLAKITGSFNPGGGATTIAYYWREQSAGWNGEKVTYSDMARPTDSPQGPGREGTADNTYAACDIGQQGNTTFSPLDLTYGGPNTDAWPVGTIVLMRVIVVAYNGGWAPVYTFVGPARPARYCLVTVSSNETAGGCYGGVLMSAAFCDTVDGGIGISSSPFSGTAGTATAFIVNLEETSATTHALSISGTQVLCGQIVGQTNEATPRAVVVVNNGSAYLTSTQSFANDADQWSRFSGLTSQSTAGPGGGPNVAGVYLPVIVSIDFGAQTYKTRQVLIDAGGRITDIHSAG